MRLGSAPGPLLSSLAHADVAQLVEHNLAKVGVAGSNPVVRSRTPGMMTRSVRSWYAEYGGQAAIARSHQVARSSRSEAFTFRLPCSHLTGEWGTDGRSHGRG